MLNTVLYNLRSAKNIGLIARSHIAFGGDFFILISPRNTWKFNGGQHSYTRQLKDENKLLLFESFEEFQIWNNNQSLIISIEISSEAKLLHNFQFPNNCNIIFGSESHGLPQTIIELSDEVVTIPQVGRVGSINVAQSAGIIQYAASVRVKKSLIAGNKFVG